MSDLDHLLRQAGDSANSAAPPPPVSISRRAARRARRAAMVGSAALLLLVAVVVIAVRSGDAGDRVPVEPRPVATTTVSRAASTHVVGLVGQDVYEYSPDGAARLVATMAGDYGFTPLVAGTAGDHVVIQNGGYLYMFDATAWSTPRRIGPVDNFPAVVTAGGVWVSFRESAPSPAMLRFYDWEGAVGDEFPLPDPGGGAWFAFGATARGVVVWNMGSSSIQIVGPGGQREIATGSPVGTTDHLVAFVETGSHELDVVDVDDDDRVVLRLALGDAGPAQTLDSGGFSPDGRHLAFAQSATSEPYPSRGVIVVDLSNGSHTIVNTAASAARWSADSKRLLLDRPLRWVDPATDQSTELGGPLAAVSVNVLYR
jgi:hypothetical protein